MNKPKSGEVLTVRDKVEKLYTNHASHLQAVTFAQYLEIV